MILGLSGHIGSHAAALVDGQLGPVEEERAWSHVLACPGCRELVEREQWTKQQLGALGGAAPLSPSLMGNLRAVDAWAAVEELERGETGRRSVAMVLGSGAVGAAVLGLLALSTPPAGLGERPTPAAVRPSVATPVAAVPGQRSAIVDTVRHAATPSPTPSSTMVTVRTTTAP